jgi:hypothetical protein
MVALGRHVEHDPRSRQYPARKATQPRSVLWTHRAPVLDQGDLGSCTGNALAQCLNTTKFVQSRPGRRYLDEQYARLLYAKATVLDTFPGAWPPTDTGSSGLGVAKAGVALGYLTRYEHAFGFDHFAAALTLQPVIVGTNWYSTMFDTDSDGFVSPAGQLAGGHEYLALGINHRERYVTFLNSWSDGWGVKGKFRMTLDDFTALLDEDGDVTVPVGKA